MPKLNAVEIKNLNFHYQSILQPVAYSAPLVFSNLNMVIPRYSCSLLLGRNGVGKSTLLKILAGKHLIKQGSVRILNVDPFQEVQGAHIVGYVAEKFEFELDIAVSEILATLQRKPDYNWALAQELLAVLEIDQTWRMHQASNGQRRRVDWFLTLIEQPQLLLLDEVTSDLDIVCRQNILQWLKKQVNQQKLTVLFATHILDGMDEWADYIVALKKQGLHYVGNRQSLTKPLLASCLDWFSQDVN